MEWKKDYEVGETLIDNQHRELINIINSFNRSISDQSVNSYQNIGITLKYLIDYTTYHFDYEETVMSRIKYPGLEEHRISHKNLISKLEGILKKFKLKESYTPIEFYYFLSGWLNSHILGEDLTIKDFIKKSKLEGSIIKSEDYNHEYAMEVIIPNLQKIDTLFRSSLIEESEVITRKTNFLVNFFNSYNISRIKREIEETMDSIVKKDLLKMKIINEIKEQLTGE